MPKKRQYIQNQEYGRIKKVDKMNDYGNKRKDINKNRYKHSERFA